MHDLSVFSFSMHIYLKPAFHVMHVYYYNDFCFYSSSFSSKHHQTVSFFSLLCIRCFISVSFCFVLLTSAINKKFVLHSNNTFTVFCIYQKNISFYRNENAIRFMFCETFFCVYYRSSYIAETVFDFL